MTESYVRYTRLKFDRPHAKVLRITMENGRMNTTDEALHRELGEIWRDVDHDPSVNVAIITGAGRIFSAGGDFSIIRQNIEDFEARARQWKEARDIVYNVINCSKPVVSAMRGVAVGAGLVCGLLADVSIASKDCRIIDGHTRLGVAAGDQAAIVWPLLCGLAKANTTCCCATRCWVRRPSASGSSRSRSRMPSSMRKPSRSPAGWPRAHRVRSAGQNTR